MLTESTPQTEHVTTNESSRITGITVHIKCELTGLGNYLSDNEQ
jgi:hypothetical protein